MPRQARIDYLGALHHVIGRGIERSKIFEKDVDKEEFLRRLKLLLDRSSMQCYAWCIMDNHFHLLLLTGKTTLARFMRCLLTGYAGYYNKEHKRSGHVFQNRYKSIVCDRDEYLLPLIRYIHLNPMRTKKVNNRVSDLLEYEWTGHRDIMENRNKEERIIEREEVLGYFGQREGKAKNEYLKYIEEGIGEKRDYSGGGLIKSAGGLQNLLYRKKDEREMYDDRILGSGLFVEEVYKREEEEESIKMKSGIRDIRELIDRISAYYGVEKEEIINTRKKEVREIRSVLVYLASKYLKESGEKLGKLLGIGSGAISITKEKGRILCREKGLEKQILQ